MTMAFQYKKMAPINDNNLLQGIPADERQQQQQQEDDDKPMNNNDEACGMLEKCRVEATVNPMCTEVLTMRF